MGLEHLVYGQFDQHGVFTGKVVAFGKDLGEKTYMQTDYCNLQDIIFQELGLIFLVCNE